MVLLFHVIIALSSIVVASYMFIRPSNRGFLTSYLLIGGTLASGTLLVITTPSEMLHICISGTAYLAVASILTIYAQKRYRLTA